MITDVALHLQGPGISGERSLLVQGLRRDDLAALLGDGAAPIGIELGLAAAGSLAVITRSTVVGLSGTRRDPTSSY